MKTLALDLSLTATGWATTIQKHGVETTAGTFRGVERLLEYEHWLKEMLFMRPEFVALEGYAFGASKAGVRGIAEWGGVARLTIHKAVIPYVEIPPATLKKYATGRGNAPKPDMRMELYKRTGLDIADDNEVDALWLLAATHQAYDEPLWKMPAVNVDALAKVDWLLVEGVGVMAGEE